MKKIFLLVILFIIPSFVFAKDISKDDACLYKDGVYNMSGDRLQTKWSTYYTSNADKFLKNNGKLFYPVNVTKNGTKNSQVYLFIYSCKSSKVIRNILVGNPTNPSHTLSFFPIQNSQLLHLSYGLIEGEQSDYAILNTISNDLTPFTVFKDYTNNIKTCYEQRYYGCNFTNFNMKNNILYADFLMSDINDSTRDKRIPYLIDLKKKKLVTQ